MPESNSPEDPLRLTGKAALATGGSRGIGAAIARSLAEDGADVAISYVSSPTGASIAADGGYSA